MKSLRTQFFVALSILSLVLFSLFLPQNGTAQQMQSTNYRIQFDSLNSGGLLSSSTNYREESSVGEQGTGEASSTNYQLRAGYQQNDDTYVTISAVTGVTIPSITGVSGGTTEATGAWRVETNSAGGYVLYVRATSSPALTAPGPYSFSDLPVGATSSFAYTVPVASSTFGFSPEGPDITSRFLDNGSICGTGSTDTSAACFDGFTTTNAAISSTVVPNNPTGATTTIRFKAGIGTSKIQENGTYTATIILTAIAP